MRLSRGGGPREGYEQKKKRTNKAKCIRQCNKNDGRRRWAKTRARWNANVEGQNTMRGDQRCVQQQEAMCWHNQGPPATYMAHMQWPSPASILVHVLCLQPNDRAVSATAPFCGSCGQEHENRVMAGTGTAHIPVGLRISQLADGSLAIGRRNHRSLCFPFLPISGRIKTTMVSSSLARAQSASQGCSDMRDRRKAGPCLCLPVRLVRSDRVQDSLPWRWAQHPSQTASGGPITARFGAQLVCLSVCLEHEKQQSSRRSCQWLPTTRRSRFPRCPSDAFCRCAVVSKAGCIVAASWHRCFLDTTNARCERPTI